MKHMRKGVVRNAENKRQFVNLLLILLAIICSNHRRHFEVQITHLTPSTLGSEILSCIQFLQGMLSQFEFLSRYMITFLKAKLAAS